MIALAGMLWYRFLLLIVVAYFSVLIFVGAKSSLSKRDPELMLTVPLMLLLQHLAYSVGFWKGLVAPVRNRIQERNSQGSFT